MPIWIFYLTATPAPATALAINRAHCAVRAHQLWPDDNRSALDRDARFIEEAEARAGGNVSSCSRWWRWSWARPRCPARRDGGRAGRRGRGAGVDLVVAELAVPAPRRWQPSHWWPQRACRQSLGVRRLLHRGSAAGRRGIAMRTALRLCVPRGSHVAAAEVRFSESFLVLTT
jgi:hypothetical protein